MSQPDLDLTPLTVGFDLRVHDIIVSVPTAARWVRYMRRDTVIDLVNVPMAAMLSSLRAAGYQVEAG